MLIFNSRDKSYKSIISALATDQKCKFRITVPRDCRCSCATLAITKDGENECTAYYNMFWAGMCGDDYEYWELHFSATTAGLYFYHFELETPWGKSFIMNISGAGVFSADRSIMDYANRIWNTKPVVFESEAPKAAKKSAPMAPKAAKKPKQKATKKSK